MTRFLLSTATAAAALVAGGAAAQTVAEQVVAGLQAQGFTRIEVETGPTQVKVEAIRGSQEVEYVYDLATGALLKREVGSVDDDDDTAPGVEFDRSDEDFVGRGDDDGSSDEDEDDDRGHGNDDDRDDDDNPGRGGDDDDEDDDRDDDDRDDDDDDRDDDRDDDEGGDD